MKEALNIDYMTLLLSCVKAVF